MNYQLTHNQIIERARNREIPIGYTENHHIIPVCLGGNNSKENLVPLTAKEHFIVHKLLVEIYPNEGGLKRAVFMMASVRLGKRNYRIGAREYSRLREDYSIVQSATMKKLCEDPVHIAIMSAQAKKRWADPVYIAKQSAAMEKRWADPTERTKMSAAQIESWADPDKRAKQSTRVRKKWEDPMHRAKMIESHKGVHFISEEHRQAVSFAISGSKHPKAKSIKIITPCGTTTSYGTIIEAVKALGFKGPSQINTALKKGGTHPTLKFTVCLT